MIAVFAHELRSAFHCLSAYVFGALLLAVIGVGCLLYNIQAAVSNVEYVLGFSSAIFIVIVPLLTMRTLAGERAQKTDQLLYSLPISTTAIVLGKYLALLVIFLLPLGLVALDPLLFSFFGDVSLRTAYGSLFAFALAGAALLALGLFLSSLTDNQGLAAGIGMAAILLNYCSVSLAEQFTSTAFGSLVVVLAAVCGIYFLVEHVLSSSRAAFLVALCLMAVTSVAFLITPESFEGLVPRILADLSVFARLDTFVNGMFDLTGIVYFLSFAGLFLFLAVQSLEKRRYN